MSIHPAFLCEITPSPAGLPATLYTRQHASYVYVRSRPLRAQFLPSSVDTVTRQENILEQHFKARQGYSTVRTRMSFVRRIGEKIGYATQPSPVTGGKMYVHTGELFLELLALPPLFSLSLLRQKRRKEWAEEEAIGWRWCWRRFKADLHSTSFSSLCSCLL